MCSSEHPYLAAYVHAFIQEDVIHTIKVETNHINDRSNRIHQFYNAHTRTWLTGSDVYCRVQSIMAITRSQRCRVVIISNMEMIEIIVNFDVNYWNARLEIFREFFYFFLLERVDPRKRRGLAMRSYAECQALVESDEWRSWPDLV